MARPIPEMELEFPGADSFLDVVTNIVGILIILIVVIGVRAKSQPVEVTVRPSPFAAELASQKTRALKLKDDLQSISEQIAAVQLETLRRSQERDTLATMLTAAKRDISEHQSALSAGDQQLLAKQNELAAMKDELSKVKMAQTEVAKTGGRKVVIENLPTPIARSVEQNEIHFQLRDGRIVYVPMQELIEKFAKVARDKVSRIGNQDTYTDSVGPLDGFVMRYTFARKELDWESAMRAGGGGTMLVLDHADFIPLAPNIGETLAQAQTKSSDFEAKLVEKKASHATVTFWVYPDSFDLFRTLRRSLYDRGFTVAGRPLPDGLPITASPYGSKSSAE